MHAFNDHPLIRHAHDQVLQVILEKLALSKTSTENDGENEDKSEEEPVENKGKMLVDATALGNEKIITKYFPNSFRDTVLEEFLHENGVKEITFCGMMSNVCVDATVRAAFDKSFSCTVADDACAIRNLSHGGIDVPSSNVHASYMAALDAVYANVISTKKIIEQIGT